VDWTNPAGGAFANSANWNNGAGPIPGAADNVRFYLTNTYTTTFTTSPQSNWFDLTGGDVTFVTNGTTRAYTLEQMRISGGALRLGPSAAELALNVFNMNSYIHAGGTLDVGFGNDVSLSRGLDLGNATYGGGVGTVNVSGTGSAFSVADYTTLGHSTVGSTGNVTFSDNARGTFATLFIGRGSMTILSGAQVTNSRQLDVSSASGFGAAAMTVTGANSSFVHGGTDPINVGAHTGAAGTLTVADGGLFDVGAAALAVRRTGIVDFAGGTLRSSKNIIVDGGLIRRTTSAGTWVFDSGSLAATQFVTVQNGGRIDVAGPLSVPDKVTLDVTGANSRFATGALDAAGWITVAAGARLSAESLTVSGGAVTVDGAGSQLEAGSLSFTSGPMFDRTVTLRNGATGTINGPLTMSGPVSMDVRVETGSALVINGDITMTPMHGDAFLTSGLGSSITQTGTGAITLGSPTSLNPARLAGLVRTGSGPILIYPTGGLGGTLHTAGDITVRGGTLGGDWMTWAPGRSLILESGGSAMMQRLPVLSDNHVVVTGVSSRFGLQYPYTTPPETTFNNNTTLHVSAGGRASFDGPLQLGTDGTTATIVADGMNSTLYAFGPARHRWGAGGGDASVTYRNRASGNLGSGISLADTGDGTTGLLSIESGAAVTMFGGFNLQTNTTGAASATITVSGEGSSLALSGTSAAGASVVGGPTGTGSATVNILAGGSLAMSSSSSLTVNPSGRVNVDGGTARLSNLAISGGVVDFHSGLLTVEGTLSIDGGGRLDAHANDVILNYPAGAPSPEQSIRQFVREGRNTGFGITTLAAPANDTVLAVADNAELGRDDWEGFLIDETTIIGKYTYYGDANLDGKVTGDDYVSVDSNLGIGNSWIEGDFTMDGAVSGDDYVAIDANLGKGTLDPLAYQELKAEMVALHVEMFGEGYLGMLAAYEAGTSAVPEPSGVAGVLGVACMLLTRRRQSFASRRSC
jgi:hypothetical protein